jgi:hypothetical protein
MLPTGVPKLLGEPIKPVVDDYKSKVRSEKSVEDMTAMEVADSINEYLSYWETKVKPSKEGYSELFGAHASASGSKVSIRYISFQGYSSALKLECAKDYLKFLMSKPKTFKTHYNFEELN